MPAISSGSDTANLVDFGFPSAGPQPVIPAPAAAGDAATGPPREGEDEQLFGNTSDNDEMAVGAPATTEAEGHGVTHESQRPRLPAGVREPTARDTSEHEATSCTVYRSWCPHCVSAKGQTNPHRDTEEASTIPEVAMDYGYMGRDDASPAALLCCKCAGGLENYACTAVPKEVLDKYTVAYLVGWIKSLGFKTVVVRSRQRACSTEADRRDEQQLALGGVGAQELARGRPPGEWDGGGCRQRTEGADPRN